MYWEYLKYVLEHKKNVFKVCVKKKMYLHAITHDLSKFYPSEFIPYARKWCGGDSIHIKYHNVEDDFKLAFVKHYKVNKHHWNYWIDSNGEPIPMPNKYIDQMICDWEAMGIKFGDTPGEFYAKNEHRINLHSDTKLRLLLKLATKVAE